LGQAAGVDNPVIRSQALALADNLLAEIALDPIISQAYRELAQAGLRDAEPANRVHSIRLAQAPGVDLLPEVVPCMRDPSAAVRAATARAAADQKQVDLSDRIDQMAQTDPSPTVQQVARYYLSCQRIRASQFEKP